MKTQKPSEFLKELTLDLSKELDRLCGEKKLRHSFIKNDGNLLNIRIHIINTLFESIEESCFGQASDSKKLDQRQKALTEHIDTLPSDKCHEIITVVLNEAEKLRVTPNNKIALHTHAYKDRGNILNVLIQLIAKINCFGIKTSSEKTLEKHLDSFQKTSFDMK